MFEIRSQHITSAISGDVEKSKRKCLSNESFFFSFLLERTLNNEILDTYQLKSLDALLELDLLQYELHRRNDDGRFQLIRKLPRQTTTNEEREQTTSYDQVIRCLGFKFDTSIWHR